ncbi:unnamed protein product, partial [Didymodactylos carnosus]
QEYYNLALTLKQIMWYTLSVTTYPYPKLNSVAKLAFAQLPSEFDSNNLTTWEQFIQAYGTHVVVSADMGGLVWAETWYEKCLSYEESETWINKQVENSWILFSTGYKGDDHKSQIDQRFKQYSIFESLLLGGTESVEPSKWSEWIPTVRSNPRPTFYRLMPLYTLLPSGKQRKALQAAITYFRQTADTTVKEYISELESVASPPVKCGRTPLESTARHISKRDVNSTNNTDIPVDSSNFTLPETKSTNFTTAKAREVLCPIVGYKGSFCPGDNNSTNSSGAAKQRRKRASSINLPHLPHGVGITIDITTGELLLPALEWTFPSSPGSHQIWTDSYSNQSYVIPNDVTVTDALADENIPTVHIFKTQRELANEWTQGYGKSSWLGGQFGLVKSILNLYKQFFTDNQATAISQNPLALYKLSVENLRLNPYAKEAVSALPLVYDDVAYNDFINSWGTHIAVETLIGGMTEQQILFKNCLFSFYGALTNTNLEAYLKQDLLSQTSYTDYYVQRRKIELNHRLGGDIEQTNLTEWQRTISLNPALLKITGYRPWSDLITDETKKSNLERAITARTDKANLIRSKEESEINEQRVNGSYQSVSAYVGILINGICNVTGPITLGNVSQCGTGNGCSTPVLIKSQTADFLADHPLRYVRDSATGFFRAKLNVGTNSVYQGIRIDVGCSFFSTPTEQSSAVYLCSGCILTASFSNRCTCVCPTYQNQA